MPIVIDRSTGKLLSAPKPMPEQREKAWEAIVKAYVEKHPQLLQQLGEEEEKEKGLE